MLTERSQVGVFVSGAGGAIDEGGGSSFFGRLLETREWLCRCACVDEQAVARTLYTSCDVSLRARCCSTIVLMVNSTLSVRRVESQLSY